MAVLKYHDGTGWEPVVSALQGPTGPTGVAVGLPTGGATGAVLVKASEADYDTAWEGTTAYRYVETVYFTSSGTFTKASYPWLRAIRVRLVGGGGGGAGCRNTSVSTYCPGRGGGGGGYAESFITNISGLSSSETVTVGTGGAGGAAGDNNGSTGGTSSFGSLVSATGGGGGNHFAGQISEPGVGFFLASPVGGGNGTAGDLLIEGSPAGPDGHAGASGFAVNSPSGGSQLGPSRSYSSTSTAVAGGTGKNYGGGATGGVSRNNSGAVAGGTGGAGIVIVELYA